MAENRHIKEAWDRQWRGKIISTCGQHMDEKAGRAAGAAWAEFFGKFPEGARILDIGTGNGLLPLIALQVSDATSKHFDVHGADYAAIDPAKALPEQAAHLDRITFHSETPTENLPFPDASIDGISAQHAFEYGDLQKSAFEVARVLKPGGSLRFLMHAAESEIIKANICKIEQARYVLENADIFTLTKEAFESGNGVRLRDALSKTAEKFKDDPNTADLTQLLELLWGAFEQRDKFESAQAFLHWITENEAELRAQKTRIEVLVNAALDKAGKDRVQKAFETLGIMVSITPVHAEIGGQVGWLLEGGKP